MDDLDKDFEAKYKKFLDELSKQADNYIAQHFGISPPDEDIVCEDNDNEKPICTTNEFIDVCKELGLVEDKL